MFLKSTLISTILLVSAVLADQRHTHHLRPLKRTDEASSSIIAGAYFRNEKDYTYAGATFNIPTMTGPDDSGIMITVTSDASCASPAFAGVVAIRGSHGTEYKAMVSGPNGSAESYDIDAGDRLKLFVNGVTGHIRVENLTKKRSVHVSFNPSQFCSGQAAIMVEEIPGGKNPFGHFGTLTFEDVGVATRSGSHGLSEAIRASDNKEVTVTFDSDSTFTVHQN